MSRLAGIVRPGGGDVAGLAASLVAALDPGLPDWSTTVATQGHAALAQVGRQSEAARRGAVVAVVDGGICNARDLPPGTNQADQVLALYLRHGFAGALTRLCGEFAVALYDGDSDTLWLGRDRVGARPCYYSKFFGGFAFASRPGPLLGLPGASHRINDRFAALFAASHYRVIDNDPQASPYAAVRQLPAAHLACLRHGEATLARWWSLADAPEFTDAEDVLAERYRDLLLTAVGQRLALDPAPAFTLSGGMDSSSVLACVVHLTGERRHAFSSVYDDRTFDESDEIASMLAANVAQWHPVRIGQVDLFSLTAAMVAAHDEPVATATWLSHWLVCREVARAGFGTLFGGLGGDEINAGEYEYFFFHFADLRRAGREDELAAEVAGWARLHDHPVWRKSARVAEAAMARLVDWDMPGRCLADRRRIERYAAVLPPDVLDLAGFSPVMDSPFASYLKNRTWQDITREAAPCCLRAEDRQTRAFGLVNADPFYDHRLLEFMFRVPGSMKIRHGVTKHLLRRAMTGILPDETRLRVKKTGWNAPAHVWFSGAQAEAVRAMVTGPGFRAARFYRVPEVVRLLDEHCAIVAGGAPAENHMMFFWQLLNLELWLEQVAAREAGGRELTPQPARKILWI